MCRKEKEPVRPEQAAPNLRKTPRATQSHLCPSKLSSTLSILQCRLLPLFGNHRHMVWDPVHETVQYFSANPLPYRPPLLSLKQSPDSLLSISKHSLQFSLQHISNNTDSFNQSSIAGLGKRWRTGHTWPTIYFCK